MATTVVSRLDDSTAFPDTGKLSAGGAAATFVNRPLPSPMLAALDDRAARLSRSTRR